MKQTIWKFETPFEAKFKISMPKSSEILCIQQDKKTCKLCIWALVYPSNELEERFFELFGTGNPICNDMGINRKYLGTYQYQNGEFIGHIFERIN